MLFIFPGLFYFIFCLGDYYCGFLKEKKYILGARSSDGSNEEGSFDGA